MIKNLFQHINLHYISLVIICIIIIFAYGNYRCRVNDKDKKSPLSDSEIVKKLKEQDFIIARRTVAK